MLRILSDLHFGDASSHLVDLAMLEPVLAGVDELWINGDLCDHRAGSAPGSPDDLLAFFTRRVPRVRFLTGNHDPVISDDHEATLAAGRIWVTHGDIFLPDIVPWSEDVAFFREQWSLLQARHPHLDPNQLADRLQLLRDVTARLAIDEDDSATNAAGWWPRLRKLLPPHRPWQIPVVWWRWPGLVDRAARRWRPAAQVIINGHIHFPRIWFHGPRCIINTGAFSGPLGCLAVDILENPARVQVRRLRRGDRAYEPLAPFAEIPLAPTPPGPLSNTP